MDFASLYDNPCDSDIKITLKNGHLHAHKVILRNRSTYFSNLLNASMSETTSSSISFPAHDDDVIRSVIAWLYCRPIDFSKLSLIEWNELLRFAHYIGEETLVSIITSNIHHNITPVELIIIGFDLELAELFLHAIQRISGAQLNDINLYNEYLTGLGYLDSDMYDKFRSQCMEIPINMHLMLEIDCNYCALSGNDILLDKYLQSIVWSTIPYDKLVSAVNLPIIAANPLWQHFIKELAKLRKIDDSDARKKEDFSATYRKRYNTPNILDVL